MSPQPPGLAVKIAASEAGVAAGAAQPLGVGRPPLAVADLPTPEEVFGVARLGWRETPGLTRTPNLDPRAVFPY